MGASREGDLSPTVMRYSRALGALGWGAIAAGYAIEMSQRHAGAHAQQTTLVWTLTVFFLMQIARLALHVVVQERKRLSLSLLLVSVVLWAVGSASLNVSSLPDLTHFPAQGEVLFLLSYLAMAAFLIVDAGRNLTASADTWLHVVVISGGAVSLAGSVVLTPAADAYSIDGVALLLALLYPLIDLVLAALVIGQALLRLRDRVYQSAALLAAFLLFATADSRFVADLASHHYHFSVLNDAAWGAGFALIVGSACRPSVRAARVIPRRQGPAETLVAGAVAIAVLALHPSGGVAPYLTVPAVITLLGAGGRLALALREARGAAEALSLSRTDDLTRLPNRRALRADMEAAIMAGRPLALMLLDMDGFKDVNDTLGHSAGDNVLRLVAHRLRSELPPSMPVARLGGDEFAVLVGSSDLLHIMELAHELLVSLHEPMRVDGIEILPSASIGISMLGADVDASELLRRADVAMYQAKHLRSGVAVYDPADDDYSKTKLQLAEGLRRALADEQFELWYQPQIESRTQELCGLEALLRWRHPIQGVLSPVEFLPAARRAGLMPAISTRVAELAVRDLVNFRRDGLDVRVAVNCAPPELLSGSFLTPLYDALVRAAVPPSAVVVEVTEDSFMAEPERARSVLHDIRAHGVQVSIDDYGTGFSSLAYLRDLPVDELKIDRTFIAALLTDSRSQMIVASTLQLAAALSMRAVAEGVEDAETAAVLADMGVDVLQGYRVSPPLAPDQVARWCAAWAASDDREQVVFGAGAVGPALDSRWSSVATRSTRVLAHRPALRRPSAN